ncbi:amino acid ABC transporter ATP-binding protein [Ruminococcus bromii]|nr:amino acid ABC transporter ATP-binding protein [Ruminococcus bromii]RGI78931.1 amino acid ABC transporter ATP-binding protein [Ruminococcus bromii]RGI82613.1 amino acid ABC transporter ATP-binding protein [Ruminococcus bromii]
MSLLNVENIRKSYGKTEVLKDISFSLKKGEVLAIIGSSGSGKTTLLRCLNFLETPGNGKISVNDKVLFDSNDSSAKSDSEIRKRRLHFGLVFQSFNLFPQYTVIENIMLAPKLAAKEQIKQTGEYMGAKSYKEAHEIIKSNAKSLLERVGLSEKSESYPCNLSGGQQQRVAIARALALNPDVLCFDEPTSALDPELTGEVLNVIRSLKTSDSTMIVVTHEIEFARDVADKIIFMADGIIAEEGTPEQVINNPQNPRTQAFLSRFN